MPAISKIRLTNVVYESGDKRFNDELFILDGNNTAILLENGGGKTVLIHTVLQAVLPHTPLGERKIKETLQLENSPAHIAIEWMINEHPRRYLVTAVSLFLVKNELKSHKYVFEYEANHQEKIENIPFVRATSQGERAAYREEMSDYYSAMKQKTHNAMTFDTMKSFHEYLETNYQIITEEWESIVKINQDEGGIEQFFENCKTTTDLYDRLLIPTVEDSIEGHEEGMFADMFEKQREGFQMYRKLQQSIQEHQAIQDELQTYVNEYQNYDEQARAYTHEQQMAKGLAETLEKQQAEVEEAQSKLENSWQAWEKEQYELAKQYDSYYILRQQLQTEEAETHAFQQEELYQLTENTYEQNEHQLYSLDYAKKKNEQTSARQLLNQYAIELEKFDETSEASDVQNELEIARGKLHGYFQLKLEGINELQIKMERDIEPIKEKLTELTTIIAEKTTDKQTGESKINQLVGEVNAKNQQLQRLRQTLLANPQLESVEAQFSNWQERSQQLDDDIVTQKNNRRDCEHGYNELTEKLETVSEALQLINHDIVENKTNRQQMDKAHEKVLHELIQIRPSWKMTKDVHLKASSMTGTLDNEVEKRTKERVTLLYEERLAHRFIDDYGEQVTFFADPFIEARIRDWQSQFYVEAGVNYVNDMRESLSDEQINYTLWPITLITTAADKPTLLKKMKEVQTHLQFPLQIVTLEEANQLNSGEQLYDWIAPSHWQENQSTTTFTHWKDDLIAKADVITNRREDKETELDEYKRVYTLLHDFLSEYPHEWKETLFETIRSLETDKQDRENTMKEIKEHIHSNEEEIRNLDSNIATYQDQKNGYDNMLEQANQYFEIVREIKKLEIKKQEYENEYNQYAYQLRELERDKLDYTNEKQSLDEQITRYKIEQEKLTENEMYQQVKGYHAITTEEAKEVIEANVKQLENKLAGIQSSYQHIQTKVEGAQQTIDRLDKELTSLIRTFSKLDTELVFPVDGIYLLEQAQTKREPLSKEVTQSKNKYDEAKEKLVQNQTKLNMIIGDYEQAYPDETVITFKNELAVIENELAVLDKQVIERKQFLQAEKERIDKEWASITQASQELSRYSVAHQLTSTIITPVYLTEKELVDFRYKRMDFVNAQIEQLEKSAETLQSAGDKITEAKQQFKRFCYRTVTNQKMREMATSGIDEQHTYNDILDFQQHLIITIEKADQYARNYIANQDKEVRAFINSMHNHLINVVEQLKVIPKQTKVKIGEKSKEIFLFTIPEWQEEDGKNRIQAYLDWILEQLEADQFKQEQGTEDEGKIRKHVETWLHTKQLLQVVMDNQVMKVTCRKVTNDNQITSRPTSWEQSQKWSGGEKWSKNMTLYLGILNFIAEKKQFSLKQMKRHRAVILDNPFGKASSDHVLNPVFFIAEQLGFQMIALTAHADGKFLQDYFPIIYSMKLRGSKDHAKQVMTKTKSLHSAYFRDHEPEEMERLEEKEQLELF